MGRASMGLGEVPPLGHSRKNPITLPTEEISAVQRGRGQKFVSDNSKSIRTSKGGRVNFQFPLWGGGEVWMFSGITHC